jgi:hypothetical protein
VLPSYLQNEKVLVALQREVREKDARIEKLKAKAAVSPQQRVCRLPSAGF